jgi:hypothetical protein
MKQSQSQSRNSQTQSQNQSAPGDEITKPDETIPQRVATAERDILADGEEAPLTQPKDAYHDIGSGEEETADGLDPETEFVRQAAEEDALDAPDSDDVPVFDRANRSERM